MENRQQQGSGGIRKNSEEATAGVQASPRWSARAQAVPGSMSKADPRFAAVGDETGKNGHQFGATIRMELPFTDGEC